MTATWMMMRLLAVIVSGAGWVVVVAAESPPTVTTSWRLPPATAQALDALMDQAVVLGLPDARGAQVWRGSVIATIPASPGDLTKANADENERVFTSDITRQPAADGKHIVINARGTHLRLADGSWLLAMTEPAAAATIDAGHAELAPSAPFTMGEPDPQRLAGFMEEFDSAAMTTVRACLATVAQVTLEPQRATPLAVCHLWRAGVPDGDAQVQLAAGLWSALEAPISFGNSNQEMAGEPASRRRPLPDAVRAVRVMLFMYFRARAITQPDAARSTAAALAMLDAPLRAWGEAQLALDAGVGGLPASAPDGADLALRLQCWMPAQNDAPLMQMGVGGQNVTPSPLLPFTDAEMPALLALLDDPRPSRWHDGDLRRTLGDNVWRALAVKWAFDPRLLLARDVNAAWTDAERSASAQAMRAWWTQHGAQPLGATLLSQAASLSDRTVLSIACARPTEKTALCALLAKRWQSPPAALTPALLAQALRVGRDQSALTGVIATWPLTGHLRPLLATWHQIQGDSAPIDALWAELLTSTDAAAPRRMAALVPILMEHPSAAREQQVLTLLRGPLDAPRTWAVLAGLQSWREWDDPDYAWLSSIADERNLFDIGDDVDQALYALPLTLIYVALHDQRPLPAAIDRTMRWGMWRFRCGELALSVDAHDGEGMPLDSDAITKLPADLRVADLAAALLVGNAWHIGVSYEHQNELQASLTDDLANRDTALMRLDALIAPLARAARKQADLPPDLPAVERIAAPAGEPLF